MKENQLDVIFPKDQTWSHYQFDTASYYIFLLLQQNPLIPVNTIANELGYSTTLVNSRIDLLKRHGFLRPDRKILVPLLGERLQTEVESVYDPASLGLHRINVFLKEIPSFERLHQLETLLAIHPYTHYHVASFGEQATLFCQFDIPPTTTKYLGTLLEILEKEGYIGSSTSMEQKFMAKSSFDFRKWEIKQNKWKVYEETEFEETSGETELDYLWKDFLDADQMQYPTNQEPEFVFDFDQTDMKLLRELTVNAKPNISELSTHYDISRSRVSRRLKRLRELVISDHQLYYDQTIFDLTYPQIITANFPDNQDFNSTTLYSFLTNDYLPFSTTAIGGKKEFLWFTIAPPSFIPLLTRFVWQHAHGVQLYQLDLSTSRNYYFYHTNLRKRGEWIDSKSYFIDEPLDDLQELTAN